MTVGPVTAHRRDDPSPHINPEWPGTQCPAISFPGMISQRVVLFVTAIVALPATPAADIHGAASESRPLPERRALEATLFTHLSPTLTGVALVHSPPPTAPLTLLQEQGAGAGVCIGDVDADGRPDLFFSNYNLGCRLYRNLGDWRFADATLASGIDTGTNWCGGVTMIDIDNDGDLDLHVCCLHAPNQLWINRGNGRFDEAARARGIAWTGASVVAAFGDYDRDGRTDLYLVTHRDNFDPRGRLPSGTRDAGRKGILQRGPDSRPVVAPTFANLFELLDKGEGRLELSIAGEEDLLFHQLPNGLFTNVTAAAGIAGHDIGLSAVWWDFDGDGWPDIHVANDHKSPDRLWHNLRNGTFSNVAPAALRVTPLSSMGTDVGDVNNDGRLDLIATDMAGSTHARRMLLDGESERHRWFLEQSIPRQTSRNTLYLATGTTALVEAARLAGIHATDWTWSPKFADFDNDGFLDLFIANGMSHDYLNGDVLAELARIGTSGWRQQPALRERNLAFRNRPPLAFEPVAREWGLDALTASFGAAIGDLDGDGDADLVVVCLDEPVSIYRNNESIHHRAVVRLIGIQSQRSGLGTLVTAETSQGRQTRTLQSTSGFMSANEPLLPFGLGHDRTIQRLEVNWPSGARQFFTNLPSDHTYIIREPASNPSPAIATPPQPARAWFSITESAPRRRHIPASVDDLAVQPLLPWRPTATGPALAVATSGGDAADTTIITGASPEFRGEPSPQALTRPGDGAAVWMDVNGDGRADLLIASGPVTSDDSASSPSLRLYLDDGRGTLVPAPPGAMPPWDSPASVLAAADFDQDGDLDVFVGARPPPGQYPRPARSRLLENRQGRFSAASETSASGLDSLGIVNAAVWTDINRDGWIDLAVSEEWGSIRLFTNHLGRLGDSTRESGFAGRRGFWHGILSADLDNDGDFDLVTANAGRNPALASTLSPRRLHRGDFFSEGREMVLESRLIDGDFRPFQPRSILLGAIPKLADALPTFASLSTASLPDLVPASRLGESFVVEADESDTGVWWNDGSGRFAFAPLPPGAQLAPTFGTAALDLDGDGLLDLVLAQNRRDNRPDLGPMAGSLGVVLRGTGQQRFEPVPALTSGWIVPQDARALALSDLNLDGWPDLLVGVHGGSALAAVFEPGALPAAMVPFRFQLDGRSGNPSAVGATVTVRFHGGSRRVFEIHAGDGYRSQSTARCFVPHPVTDPPVELRVRWPDGSTSVHRVNPANRGLLVLRQPAGR